MKPCYDDIIEQSTFAPEWWDENGTPRFRTFEPAMCARLDARQAIHLQVCCPHCRGVTSVAVSSPSLDLDIMSDLAARGAGGLYGLLPQFNHCGRAVQPELMGVYSAWRRNSMVLWQKVFP